MPVADAVVFRQCVCHFPPCGAVFYLCRRCDRGQRYCSARCREKARRLQLRQANRRHQQTPEGRADHRDHQREYRQRLKARVTDQASPAPSACAKNETVCPAFSVPEFDRQQSAPRPASELAEWVVCQICGCRGHWINPFSEVKT